MQGSGRNWYVMSLRVVKIARSLRAFLILFGPALILAGVTPAPQGRVADFFKPQDQLESFEVYHVSDRMLYYTDITLEELISSRPPARDYARIRAENRYAVNALYSALNETVVFLAAPCDAHRIDVRWAIVFNYTDHTKAALGFNRLAHCVQLSSRKTPIAATTDLVEFVDRTFGFMR